MANLVVKIFPNEEKEIQFIELNLSEENSLNATL